MTTEDTMKIYNASPEAMQPVQRKEFQPKYPWDKIEVGQAFAIPKDQIKLITLKPYAHRMGKKFGKKFRVVEHPDVYEVARVPLEDGQEQKPTNIVEALRQQEGKSE